MAAWNGDAWRKRLRDCAAPHDAAGRRVLLAAGRSPGGYIADGVAINRESPRYSGDIDIFHDSAEGLAAATDADAQALTGAGLNLSWRERALGNDEAIEFRLESIMVP